MAVKVRSLRGATGATGATCATGSTANLEVALAYNPVTGSRSFSAGDLSHPRCVLYFNQSPPHFSMQNYAA